jgi:hypothetical protein
LPKITHEEFFGSAEEKIKRLGLLPLYNEVKQNISTFELLVLEKKDGNGAAKLREMIDTRFKNTGWEKVQSGGVDWTKCHKANGITVCLGTELQISGRSDLISVDLIHLKDWLECKLDIGVLVVPNDTLGRYLTDRTPRLSDAKRHIKITHAQELPMVLLAIEHDGPGPALPKQIKKDRKGAD